MSCGVPNVENMLKNASSPCAVEKRVVRHALSMNPVRAALVEAFRQAQGERISNPDERVASPGERVANLGGRTSKLGERVSDLGERIFNLLVKSCRIDNPQSRHPGLGQWNAA